MRERNLSADHRDQVMNDLREIAGLIKDDQEPVLTGWPTEIGGYTLVDELPWGGQAATLLAYDRQLQRHVVLKLYDRISPEQREAVLKEGRALAKVNSPYVGQCFAAETYGDCPYLVLEYFDGGALSDFGNCGPRKAREIVGRLAEGLQAIHDAGLVHGDIKPSNIVVDAQGMPRFIDFGLATNAGLTGLGSGDTSSYAAPEKANDSTNIDRRAADIFSLGAVLYFLLSGRPPFKSATKTGTRALARKNEHPPIEEIVPDVPRSLASACRRCMATEPRDRYPDARSVKDAVRDGRRKTAVLAIATCAVVAIAGFWLRGAVGSASDPQGDPRGQIGGEQTEGRDSAFSLADRLVNRFVDEVGGAPIDPVRLELVTASVSTDVGSLKKDHQGRVLLDATKNASFKVHVNEPTYVAIVSVHLPADDEAPPGVGEPEFKYEALSRNQADPENVLLAEPEKPAHFEELEFYPTGQTECLVVLASARRLDLREYLDTRTYRGIRSRPRERRKAHVMVYVVRKKKDD